MNKPKRTPDFIGPDDGWEYWFDEMLVLTKFTHELKKIKIINNKFHWKSCIPDKWNEDSNTHLLMQAYENYIAKKLLE